MDGLLGLYGVCGLLPREIWGAASSGSSSMRDLSGLTDLQMHTPPPIRDPESLVFHLWFPKVCTYP